MRDNNLSIIVGILLLIPILVIILKKLQLRVFAKYNSEVSDEIVVKENVFRERSLDFGTYPQGIAFDSARIQETYWYYMAELALQKVNNDAETEILHVGLGAGTIPHLLALRGARIKQTIIEIDDNVIEANKQFFAFNNLPNTTLIKGDFFKLLENQVEFVGKFDVLIVDICTGQPPFISYEASSPENIDKTMAWAKPNALIIYNRWIDNDENTRDANKLIELLKQKCTNVQYKNIVDYHNFKNAIISGLIQ